MKLGIKVGPQTTSFQDLTATNPEVCEVWFDIHRIDEYTGLFGELKRRNIDVGLHFWGVCDENVWANIAYPDKTLIDESMALMRQTIDIAAQHRFQYVNIHPGCQTKVRLNFKAEEFILLSEPVPLDINEQLLIENTQILSVYARHLGIMFTVETVPARIVNKLLSDGAEARKYPMNIYELPVESVVKIAQLGIPIANDVCHTAANCITDDAASVWSYLKEKTIQLVPQTKLIHLGFVIPPYNGVDYHDDLDNPLITTNQAVPNRNQMIELLKLFQHRDDVWIITEPQNDHVKNYFLAKEIVDQAIKSP